jgi:hypothetical protein
MIMAAPLRARADPRSDALVPSGGPLDRFRGSARPNSYLNLTYTKTCSKTAAPLSLRTLAGVPACGKPALAGRANPTCRLPPKIAGCVMDITLRGAVTA